MSISSRTYRELLGTSRPSRLHPSEIKEGVLSKACGDPIGTMARFGAVYLVHICFHYIKSLPQSVRASLPSLRVVEKKSSFTPTLLTASNSMLLCTLSMKSRHSKQIRRSTANAH